MPQRKLLAHPLARQVKLGHHFFQTLRRLMAGVCYRASQALLEQAIQKVLGIRLLNRHHLEVAKFFPLRSGLSFGFGHEGAERVGVMNKYFLRPFVGFRNVQCHTQFGRQGPGGRSSLGANRRQGGLRITACQFLR